MGVGMSARSLTGKVTGFLAVLVLGLAGCARAEEVPAVILDTDMGGDCDDVGALFMLHGAVERGEARLVAVMGCTSSATIAPAIDGINGWFGRGGIPVGTLKDGGFKDGPSYTDELARRYPHRFAASGDYPDAVGLYREMLAKEPDGSVVITAVGPLRNLANLLRSGADAKSPLDGKALVAKKVKRLEVMGGKYPPTESKNEKDVEYNFEVDAASAALVCAEWPGRVLFNGEGGSVNSGRRVTFEMPEHNPLTMAYAFYPGVGYAGDRLSWDPISVLVSVRGAGPWFREVRGGKNVTDAVTGRNRWVAGEDGGHSYLVMEGGRAKRDLEAALEEMMVAGVGRPERLDFDTAAYGIRGATCRFSASGGEGIRNAFDGDDRSEWRLGEEAGWLRCEYGEGRRYAVSSVVVVAADEKRRPRGMALSGSNVGGETWTVLAEESGVEFEAGRCVIKVAQPGLHGVYRLAVRGGGEGLAIGAVELVETVRCDRAVAVTAVEVDRERVSVPVLGRVTLNAAVKPWSSWDRLVKWSSSDPEVAEVRAIGEHAAVVRGKREGTAVVTATVGGKRVETRVTVTGGGLAEGWRFEELGSPAILGSVRMEGARCELTGCGHAMTGFWERVRDQGSYVHRAVEGDGGIEAKLVTMGPDTGGPAYQWDYRPAMAAGLMLRESVSEPQSRYVLVQVEASGKLVVRWRDEVGPDDNQRKELGMVGLPVHLRIERRGDEVRVYASGESGQWGEPRFRHRTMMGGSVRAGMVVCSGNSYATSGAGFEEVRSEK